MPNIVRENFPRVREAIKNGVSYWVCDARSAKLYPQGREEWFSTQAAALARHQQIKDQLETGTVVTPAELALFRQWKTRFAALPDTDGKTVLERMEYVLKRYVDGKEDREENKEPDPTIAELCDLWIEAKERGATRKLRPSTLNEIRGTAKLIRSRWGDKRYQSLKKEHIRDFLEELTTQKAHTTTKRKWRVRIGGFCQWCIDSGKGRGNVTRGIKIPSVPTDMPAIMTIEQVKAIISACEKEEQFRPLIKFVTIGLFAGLRPHEIHRLEDSNIQLEKTPYTVERYKNIGPLYGIIDVRASAAKTGRPRKVVINQTLASYLEAYKDQPIYPKINFRKTFESLRTYAGFVEWQSDIVRHTSASYFVSKTQDWALTASQFGNSVAVLERYYVDTIHPRLVDQFYALRPIITNG